MIVRKPKEYGPQQYEYLLREELISTFQPQILEDRYRHKNGLM